MKKHLIAIISALFIVWGASAQTSEIFAPAGKAIKGYDVVDFFKVQQPVMGTDSFAYTYKKVQWLFSSRENLEAFKADPEKYIPQYGGYCAYGTSQGHKAPTETGTWTIVNDRLYFNYNQKVKSMWLKDQQALIKKADLQWDLIKDKP